MEDLTLIAFALLIIIPTVLTLVSVIALVLVLGMSLMFAVPAVVVQWASDDD